MWVFLAFVVGILISDFYHKYKMIKVLEQLDKVCGTGDELWQSGVIYAMRQIEKIY